MNKADMLLEIALAMGSTDDSNDGCFEFCDGEPLALKNEQKAILYATTDTLASEIDDPLAHDALIERAKRFRNALNEVVGVCARECEGTYSLFEDDSELYDSEGNPVIRTCPLKDRLAGIALDFSISEG